MVGTFIAVKLEIMKEEKVQRDPSSKNGEKST